MMDVGGQDASEAFEDVGHSDEAREILNGLLVGTIERKVTQISTTVEKRGETDNATVGGRPATQDTHCTSHLDE